LFDLQSEFLAGEDDLPVMKQPQLCAQVRLTSDLVQMRVVDHKGVLQDLASLELAGSGAVCSASNFLSSSIFIIRRFVLLAGAVSARRLLRHGRICGRRQNARRCKPVFLDVWYFNKLAGRAHASRPMIAKRSSQLIRAGFLYRYGQEVNEAVF
jgi:hypothetical protein